MPEGHTVHRVARDHRKLFAGQPLAVGSPQGRFLSESKRLSGAELLEVEAHGKHLFYTWNGRKTSEAPRILHIHLGLYGKLRLHRKRIDGAWPEPRGAVRLRVEGPDAAFDLNGPNRCELLTPGETETLRERLGPDPLRPDADPERVWRRIHRSRAPIGTLLLNQSVIAGVGNIYRSEALHLLGVHPERPGAQLERDEFDRLWESLVELMSIGVRLNRIVIADPQQIGKPRSRMTRDERLRIYKKPACPDCGGPVTSWTLGARQAYACPACQE